MKRLTFVLAVLALGATWAEGALFKVEPYVSGFNRPVFMTAPPGDTNRFFVIEQHTGNIRIIQRNTGTIQSSAFMRVTGLTTQNEQGLLGMAFHPGFATNGYFYLNYTTTGGGAAGHTEISRFQATGDPMTATSASFATKKVILTYDQPEWNHNAGWTAFGPDGYLYISSGDGGGGDDQHGTGNGQNRNVLLGKLLRIDVDHGDPYDIPDGNPYKGSLSMRGEIWAFGLRNPWRCSFDRETGDIWIADVGQDRREEVDFLPAGQGGWNFGWRAREGTIQNPTYPNEKPVTEAVEPIFDYPHPTGVSITGGYLYRGTKIPALRGKYIFCDYGSGQFWATTRDGTNFNTTNITKEISANPIVGVSSFAEDGDGELYFMTLSPGTIYKIVSAAPPAPAITDLSNTNSQFVFSFSAAAGQAYALESRPDLGTNSTWEVRTNISAAGTATNVTLTNAVTGEEMYFRVRAE